MTNSIVKRDDRPTLEEVLENTPIPYDAVFLGMADDGLPMMMSTITNNSNILIWNGEVGFLKTVAEYVMKRDSNNKNEIEFIVFTNNIEEWEFLAKETNNKANTPCIGIIPFWDKLANQILLGIASWIHQGIRPNHSIIVLIEGVENVLKMDLDARQNFHYIFTKGKDRKVFAIGTVPNGEDLLGLQDLFQSSEYNQETDRYEFPEGDDKVTVWIPRTEI